VQFISDSILNNYFIENMELGGFVYYKTCDKLIDKNAIEIKSNNYNIDLQLMKS
jgi:hypothetical protein